MKLILEENQNSTSRLLAMNLKFPRKQYVKKSGLRDFCVLLSPDCFVRKLDFQDNSSSWMSAQAANSSPTELLWSHILEIIFTNLSKQSADILDLLWVNILETVAEQQPNDILNQKKKKEKKWKKSRFDLCHPGSDNWTFGKRNEQISCGSDFSKHIEMYFLSVGVTGCTSHHLRNMILHFICTGLASRLILRWHW